MGSLAAFTAVLGAHSEGTDTASLLRARISPVRIHVTPPSRSAEAAVVSEFAEPAAITAADMRPVPYSCGLRGLHVSAVLAAYRLIRLQQRVSVHRQDDTLPA